MNSWRTECVETRTSGPQGGPRKPTSRKTDTAPQPDPYAWRHQAEHPADSPTKGDRAVVTGRLRQRNWETPDGDKRSVTELEADEAAPSLRWAIAKPERAANGSKGKGEFNDDAPF
jgi:single-strand DNA-binding protein